MAVTFTKGKVQRERTESMGNAIAILGELVKLKKIARKIDAGEATKAETKQYKKAWGKVWRQAESRYEKAATIHALTNGKSKKAKKAK